MAKLVRDRIPQIIQENTGTAPVTRKLEGRELIDATLDKIIEEIGELRAARDRNDIQEEMGDVSEAVDALRDTLLITTQELEVIKKKKRDLRGGFKDGILLCD